MSDTKWVAWMRRVDGFLKQLAYTSGDDVCPNWSNLWERTPWLDKPAELDPEKYTKWSDIKALREIRRILELEHDAPREQVVEYIREMKRQADACAKCSE